MKIRFRLFLVLFLLINCLLCWSTIKISGGKSGFVNKVEDCLALFRSLGGEFYEMMHKLENSEFTHTIRFSSGTNKHFPKNSKKASKVGTYPGATGTGSGSTIRINPDNTKKFKHEDVERNFCAQLLHELQHACDADQGILDTSKGGNGVKKSEIKACEIENKFRAKQGHKQRTKYGKKLLPN